jgi:hypothetical protein
VSTQCEQDMLDLDGRKSFIKEVDSVAAELQAAGIKLRTHGHPIIPVPMRVAWGPLIQNVTDVQRDGS